MNNMINKFLYAYKRAKKEVNGLCFFRVENRFEAYYDDASKINNLLGIVIYDLEIEPGVVVKACKIPVDDIDENISKLHAMNIGTRLSEQRNSSGNFDIVCDDYYYEYPFE